MKKILLCSAVIFAMASAFSQNWCPPGARWHFKRGHPVSSPWHDGIIEMAYSTNTTVIGVPCKRLDAVFKGNRLIGAGGGYNITEPYNSYYTYENNNVVFLYNGSNAFDTLVNFNALPGDKWLKPRSPQTLCISRPVLTVTDTGHININGFFLKQIKTIDSASVLAWSWIDTTAYSYTYTYAEAETFVERIMFLGVLSQNIFPANCEGYPQDSTSSDSGPPSNVFRCYRDFSFPVYKNNWYFGGTSDCGSLTGIETIENNNINIRLYPNPNNGGFQLDLQAPANVSIINVLGETVYTACFKEPGTVTVEANQMPPGVYVLKAKTAEGNGQMKFIRQ
ncbi:MAG: T9SS type A sorting domain-containing protein [Bacteroidota bacterium]